MFKYTKTTLKKLEELFKEIGYVVRYERGNFQSGYCIVENRKIAVLNRFFDTEARINCLVEILGTLDIEENELTEKTADFYKKVKKNIIEPGDTEATENPEPVDAEQ